VWHSTVASPPLTVITGAIVSSTVIVWLQLALLPEESVAVQVLVMTVGQVWPSSVWLYVTASDPSQLSSAVTVAAAGTSARHSTVASSGHPLSTGSVVSTTVTVRVAVALFPHASVAVYVIVYAPGTFTSTVPLGTAATLPSQLSKAVAPASV
jgi:hypothetical protein